MFLIIMKLFFSAPFAVTEHIFHEAAVKCRQNPFRRRLVCVLLDFLKKFLGCFCCLETFRPQEADEPTQ
jgi:hypothetical protein